MNEPKDLTKIVDKTFAKLDLSPSAKERVRERAAARSPRAFRWKPAAVSAAALVLVFAVVFSVMFSDRGSTGVPVSAKDLMQGITPRSQTAGELSGDFIKASADFSIRLFQNAITKDKNSLVSPTSVLLALGMTANGAVGDTKSEFEKVLGGSLTMDEINPNCYNLAKQFTNIKDGKLKIADSIWFRNGGGLTVKQDFLQKNADFYGAAAYQVDFSSMKTVDDINNWVKDSTGGLIDGIVKEIDSRTVMYLINTLYFEDEWQNVYNTQSVQSGAFHTQGGIDVNVSFMHSEEQLYMQDDKAQGFVKPYKDGKYAFVALLPNEGISVQDYAASLTGGRFLTLLKSRQANTVFAAMPKFKAEYKKNLVEPLKNMGLSACFDGGKADLSALGTIRDGKLYVGEVIHKTFIQVDELGTKAGAVTSVAIKATGAQANHKTITLDRPFVYAIVDMQTGLPLFIGTMLNPAA